MLNQTIVKREVEMLSKMMIDTSVLLNLAKDFRNEPLLIDIATMIDEGHVDLVLPDVILDESCLAQCLDHMFTHPQTVMVVPQGYDSGGRYAYLAKRQPDFLHCAIVTVNRRQPLAKMPPSEDMIEGWIKQARVMPAKLEY